MNRCLLLALALCGAPGAHAADPLDADQFRAAYCVGAAQVRVLAYEQMAAVACGADLGQCTDVRRLAAAVLPRLRRELEAANAALAAYHLLDDGERPEAHRPGVWQQGGRGDGDGRAGRRSMPQPAGPRLSGGRGRHRTSLPAGRGLFHCTDVVNAGTCCRAKIPRADGTFYPIVRLMTQ